jgi:hypothetical protein
MIVQIIYHQRENGGRSAQIALMVRGPRWRVHCFQDAFEVRRSHDVDRPTLVAAQATARDWVDRGIRPKPLWDRKRRRQR